jgi:hypothetical protein
MRRRRALWTEAAVGSAVLVAFLFMPPSSLPRTKDYSPLIDILKSQQKEETPLVAFNAFEEAADREAPAVSVRFFNEHPGLLQDIRRDLGPGEISWRLERSRHRLVFVPERRERFARLFEEYCSHVVGYTLEKTRLENPYVEIRTLSEETPRVPEEGVAAFLVHNLAEEVMGTFVFSSAGRGSLKVDLSRKTFLGEVGSYTTNILFQDPRKPEFTRDRFTIWQTTAGNPFTVLSVPVEETLHIALREHTHRAIREQFEAGDTQGAVDLERIVADWVAVEEALVGGVVYALLPGFLKNHAKNLPDSSIAEDIESRSCFEQYQHLKKAIEVVGELGCEEAIRIYKDDPGRFKALVISCRGRKRLSPVRVPP